MSKTGVSNLHDVTCTQRYDYVGITVWYILWKFQVQMMLLIPAIPPKVLYFLLMHTGKLWVSPVTLTYATTTFVHTSNFFIQLHR